MKKLIVSVSFLLSVSTLAGCANTGSGNIVSDNPFSEVNGNEPDNYEEAFGKYQTGSIKYSNYSIDSETGIEYNGGIIELSFDTDTGGNTYDVEMGYMAFINGIPQKLSLNGGESSELVRLSQAPDQKNTVSLSFAPVISKELSGKDTLQLKVMSIFNPSYKPSGSFTGFGNAHSGQSFLEYDIKVNSPVEVSEDMSGLTAFSEYESIFITDEIAAKYGVKKPDENTPTNIFIKDVQSGEAMLTLHDGKIDANFLIYGMELYNYRVYVYVNHNRVKFNGHDCLETEVKGGYLNVLKLELDNINVRDIVYAVAVPVDCETGKMNLRKCGSMLVLDESSAEEITNAVNPAITETTPDNSSSASMNTDIYHYNPVGYIDSSQRYLLLARPAYKAVDETFYDYIVYDESEERVIGTLNALGDFHNLTYGEGVITIDVCYQLPDEHMEDIQIAVYNERLELVKEVYNSDIAEVYVQKFDSVNDCWYFHDNEGCFCRADGDFSNITKLRSDSFFRDYYITEDRIIYYKTVYDYSNPDDNADIFGIMDLDGNVIKETKAAPYGAGEFRIGRAGDYIYFMSPLIMYPFDKLREPMNGVIFYNIKTKEQKTVYLEDESENSCCFITPDGKYLVTDVLVMKDRNTCTDNIVRLYDIESGKLVKSKSLGTDTFSGEYFVYNDRLVLGIYGSEVYMFDSF